MFKGNLIGLGFLQSVPYIKPIPTQQKIILCCGENVAQTPLLTWSFLGWVGLGLALGWGVRRFHNNVYVFFNPTELDISQRPFSERWMLISGFERVLYHRPGQYGYTVLVGRSAFVSERWRFGIDAVHTGRRPSFYPLSYAPPLH